jgi:signal transduction histidine kinase
MTTVLLKDLLDLAQMENGKFKINRALTHLPSVFERSIHTLKQRLENKKITVEVMDNSAVSEFLNQVFIDADRMNQVMTNLISNAIKFSKKGQSLSLITRVTGHTVLDRDSVDVTDEAKEFLEQVEESKDDDYKPVRANFEFGVQDYGTGMTEDQIK